MRNFCCLTFSLFIINISQAQFGPQQVISTDALFPRKVAVGDMDGNGTLDVLSAARATNELAWYSNETGIGDFGSLRLISESSENNAIVPGDLDGDGDLDIVASSADGDIVFWQENIDGLGNFGSQQFIATLNGAFDIALADIDNDEDLDIISGSFVLQILNIHRNMGDGTFSPPVQIGHANGRGIATADLDLDNDLDIIVTATGSSSIVGWYENLDGLGTYSSYNSVGNVTVPSSTTDVFVKDIDQDGYPDICISSNDSNFSLAWFRNINGSGDFSGFNIIESHDSNNGSVFLEDLDNDSDNDVLTTTNDNARVSWYENLDGLGNFGSQQTITTNAISARHVIAADLDNDGDMDVISASQNDNKIAWYENDPKFVGFETQNLAAIHITPNPTKDRLLISGLENFNQDVWIKIYSLSGEKMIFKKLVVSEIDLNTLSSGIYFVELASGRGSVIKKVVKL